MTQPPRITSVGTFFRVHQSFHPRRLLLDIIRRRRRPNYDLLHQRSASRIFMPQHPAVRQVRSTQNIEIHTLLRAITNLPSLLAFQYRGTGILSCSVPALCVFAFNDPIFDILHTASQRLDAVYPSRKEQDCWSEGLPFVRSTHSIWLIYFVDHWRHSISNSLPSTRRNGSGF